MRPEIKSFISAESKTNRRVVGIILPVAENRPLCVLPAKKKNKNKREVDVILLMPGLVQTGILFRMYWSNHSKLKSVSSFTR